MITNDDEEEDIKNSEKMTINFLSVVKTFHFAGLFLTCASVKSNLFISQSSAKGENSK